MTFVCAQAILLICFCKDNRLELSTSSGFFFFCRLLICSMKYFYFSVKRLENDSIHRQRSLNKTSNEIEQTLTRRKSSVRKEHTHPIPDIQTTTIPKPIPPSSKWSLQRFFLPFALIM